MTNVIQILDNSALNAASKGGGVEGESYFNDADFQGLELMDVQDTVVTLSNVGKDDSGDSVAKAVEDLGGDSVTKDGKDVGGTGNNEGEVDGGGTGNGTGTVEDGPSKGDSIFDLQWESTLTLPSKPPKPAEIGDWNSIFTLPSKPPIPVGGGGGGGSPNIGLDASEFSIVQKLIAVGNRLDALTWSVVHGNLAYYSTDYINGGWTDPNPPFVGPINDNLSTLKDLYLDDGTLVPPWDNNSDATPDAFLGGDLTPEDIANGIDPSTSQGMYIVGVETDKIALSTSVLTKAEDAKDRIANKILSTYV